MTKKEAKKLYKLIKRWTRAEIMARIGQFDNLEFIDYALKEVEYRDKIRELLYGTSNLVELGEQFGMLGKIKSKKNKKRFRKHELKS